MTQREKIPKSTIITGYRQQSTKNVNERAVGGHSIADGKKEFPGTWKNVLEGKSFSCHFHRRRPCGLDGDAG